MITVTSKLRLLLLSLALSSNLYVLGALAQANVNKPTPFSEHKPKFQKQSAANPSWQSLPVHEIDVNQPHYQRDGEPQHFFSNNTIRISPARPIYIKVTPGQSLKFERETSHQTGTHKPIPIKIHVAQGRGVFREQADKQWRSDYLLYQNNLSRPVWLMLRADSLSEKFKIFIKHYDELNSDDEWIDQGSTLEDFVLIDVYPRKEKKHLFSLQQHAYFEYKAEYQQRIKLDYYTDFSTLANTTNLNVELNWSVDGQPEQSQKFYANPNIYQKYISQCALVLGFKNSTIIELNKGQTIRLRSSHNGFLGLLNNRSSDYLFDVNRPNLKRNDSSSAGEATMEQKWYTVLRSLQLPVNLNLSDNNNTYLRRRGLYPYSNSVPSKTLYSTKGTTLKKELNELFFSRENSYSNYQKLVLGQFYQLNQDISEHTFTIPDNRVGRELELEVALENSSDELIPLSVQFDQSLPTHWLIARRLIDSHDRPNLLSTFLETSIDQDHSAHVSESAAFARFREKAPTVTTGIAYIHAPQDTKFARIFVQKPNHDKANNVQSRSSIWVSLRDFTYRSILNDSKLLTAPETRGLKQLTRAFKTLKNIEATSLRDKSKLLEVLENLPQQEQTELILWARLYKSAQQSWLAISQKLQRPTRISGKGGMTRFEQNDDSWLSSLKKMFESDNPEMAINYLSGTALYNPNLGYRQHAIDLLYSGADKKLSLFRLEQIMLAAIYEDTRILPLIHEQLLWVLSKTGKFELIKVIPKLSQATEQYDLLTSIAALDDQGAHKLIENTQLDLNSDFANLRDVYRTINSPSPKAVTEKNRTPYSKVTTAEQTQVLGRFGYWKSNNRPARVYDHHVLLNNVERPNLKIDAFLVDRNKQIQLVSNQLGRYRIKVAPISSLNGAGGQHLFTQIHLRNDQVNRAYSIANHARTRWWFNAHHDAMQDVQLNSDAVNQHFIGIVSALPIDQEFHQAGVLTITADQPSIVYLERLEDPLSLLQMQSESNDTVDKAGIELNTVQAQNRADLRGNLSHNCSENRSVFLAQSSWYRPLSIEHIAFKARTSAATIMNIQSPIQTCNLDKPLVVSCVDDLTKGLDKRDIASAASLLNLANNPSLRLTRPGIRSSVFEVMSWRELRDMQSPAGSIKLKDSIDIPLTTLAQQRKQLSTTSLNSPYRITGDSVQGFSFYSDNANTRSVVLQVDKTGFDKARSVTVWIKVSGNKPSSVTLETGVPSTRNLEIARGNNDIKIWLAPQNNDDSLSISFEPSNKLANRSPSAQTRTYQVATADQPVLVKVFGPQWLKSIRRVGDSVLIKEQYIHKGWQTLKFKASGQSQALYRFYVLQENYRPGGAADSPTVTDILATLDGTIDTSLSRAHTLNRKQSTYSQPSIFKEFKSLNDYGGTPQANGHNLFIEPNKLGFRPFTFGMELTHADRQNGDDDFESFVDLLTNYTELHGFARQRNNERGDSFSLDGRYRHYTQADVFQLSARYDHQPIRTSNGLSWGATLESWHQDSQANQGDITSTRLIARLGYQKEPSQRHRLTTRFDLWKRARTLDQVSNFDLVDPDVWSLYKEHHQHGASLSQRWTYRNRLDSQLYADAGVVLNEGLTTIDRNSVQLGWRAYVKRRSFDINLINRRFFKDQNRDNAFTRNDLRVSGDWPLPFSNNSNLKLGVRAQYNFNGKDVSWWLNLGWFQHAGQQLHDFRPGEYRFRSVRNWWLENTSTDKKFGSE